MSILPAAAGKREIVSFFYHLLLWGKKDFLWEENMTQKELYELLTKRRVTVNDPIFANSVLEGTLAEPEK